MKWVKSLDKVISRAEQSDVVSSILNYLRSKASSQELLDFENWKKLTSSTSEVSNITKLKNWPLSVLNCSAKLAVEPCEEVCEKMQELASTAMALPSCSITHGLTSTLSKTFMKLIEDSMSNGLKVLQCMTSLMSVDYEVNASIQRLEDQSIEKQMSSIMREVSMELLMTSFGSASTKVNACADLIGTDLTAFFATIIFLSLHFNLF